MFNVNRGRIVLDGIFVVHKVSFGISVLDNTDGHIVEMDISIILHVLIFGESLPKNFFGFSDFGFNSVN